MPKDPRLIDAEIAKLEAEAASALADARARNAEAEVAERNNRVSELAVAAVEREEIERLASDVENRVLRFLGPVTAASARSSIDRLVKWSRITPGCDITIVIDSPGGGIIEGFALYDEILNLRANGHKVTTITKGMAASMGGILLQAGDERVAGPNASILIHEASFMAGGSFGEVEDTVEFVKKLQERLLGILAERSSLSATQIKNRWKRKNWWLDANEALKFGFIDRIA